jgi:hypothetical protein
MLSPVVHLIVNMFTIILSLICIVGFVWLTMFTFQAKMTGNGEACFQGVTPMKLNFAKFLLVILWIQIIFSLASSLLTLQKQTFGAEGWSQ